MRFDNASSATICAARFRLRSSSSGVRMMVSFGAPLSPKRFAASRHRFRNSGKVGGNGFPFCAFNAMAITSPTRSKPPSSSAHVPLTRSRGKAPYWLAHLAPYQSSNFWNSFSIHASGNNFALAGNIAFVCCGTGWLILFPRCCGLCRVVVDVCLTAGSRLTGNCRLRLRR